MIPSFYFSTHQYAPMPDPVFSLYTHMTSFDRETYQATKLSKYLIGVLADDASRARRNTLTLYRLVELVRDVCRGIDSRIADVEADGDDDDSDGDDYDWTRFDEYTQAIIPLEEFLLTLANLIGRDCEKFLPADLAVNDLIASVQEWEDNRTELRNTLSILKSNAPIKRVFPELDATNLDLEGTYDDLGLLFDLCIAIDKHSLWEKEFTAIEDMHASAKAIASQSNPSTPEHSVKQSIRCAMLVFGAMNLADTTKSDLKKIGRRLLNSKSLWMQAAKVLDTVKKHLTNPDTIAVNDLETEWDEFKRFLLAFEVELPPEYIALRKALKAVRRPYYSRSVFLVSKCRELAAHFTSTPEVRIAGNIPVLKDTFSKVMAAIGKAEEEVHDHPNLDSEAVAAFDEAFDQLKTSFGMLKLDGDRLEIDRDEASKTDQGVDQRFDQSKQPRSPEATDSVTVTVTVKVDDADTSFTVGMDTTLRTISYQLALQYPLDKRLRLLRGCLTKADGTTVVPNDQTVSALLSSDGPGRPESLKLNFRDTVPSSPNLDDDTSDRAEEEEDEDEDEDEEDEEEEEDEKDEDKEDDEEEDGNKDEDVDEEDEEEEGEGDEKEEDEQEDQRYEE